MSVEQRKPLSCWKPQPASWPALTFALKMFAHQWCRIDSGVTPRYEAQQSVLSDVLIHPCRRSHPLFLSGNTRLS